MGIFDNKYPYSDFHELNLDWILETVSNLEKRVDSLKNEFLEQANKYTDEKFAEFKNDLSELEQELNTVVRELQAQYSEFTRVINARIQFIQNDIDNLNQKIDAEIIGANEYTNQAIAQNNDYLIEKLSETVGSLLVINFFNGEKVTIQEMFDTLAKVHIQDPLTYTEYAEKNITNENLSLLNISYTDLVLRGKQLIP